MAERLIELGAVLIGLAILARLADRVGLPTVSLYLVAGLAFGEGGIVPLVTTQDFVHAASEIGLILLLFMLGLEYPASELLAGVRRSSGAGAIDLVLNVTPGVVAGLLLGWGLVPALFLGGITLPTSSGIVAKLLGDTGLATSAEGRFVTSIAVIEDLTMAVYLPLLGALVIDGATLAGGGTALLSIAAVAIVLALAVRVDVGIGKLVFSRSDEALLLTILGIAIVVAGLAELVQVSAAVGALLAGIVLSGPAAREARTLLAPLRDLFAALFFAFIGLSVDPATLPPMLGPAAILAVVCLGAKVATGVFGGRISGLRPDAARRAGWLLVPRGEFSIAIAGLAVAAGLEPDLAPMAVSFVLLLAVMGPLAVKVVGAFRGAAKGVP